MKTNIIATFTVLALAASTSVLAAGTNHPARQNLREAQQTLAWRAQNSKGSYAQELKAQERKVDGLINDLEHGRSVDPGEIDPILERANRGAF
jgi:TolA-binding protein